MVAVHNHLCTPQRKILFMLVNSDDRIDKIKVINAMRIATAVLWSWTKIPISSCQRQRGHWFLWCLNQVCQNSISKYGTHAFLWYLFSDHRHKTGHFFTKPWLTYLPNIMSSLQQEILVVFFSAGEWTDIADNLVKNIFTQVTKCAWKKNIWERHLFKIVLCCLVHNNCCHFHRILSTYHSSLGRINPCTEKAVKRLHFIIFVKRLTAISLQII